MSITDDSYRAVPNSTKWLDMSNDYLITKVYEDRKEMYYVSNKEPGKRKMEIIKEIERRNGMKIKRKHCWSNLNGMLGEIFLVYNKSKKKDKLYQIYNSSEYKIVERSKEEINNFYTYLYYSGGIAYIWKGSHSTGKEYNYGLAFGKEAWGDCKSITQEDVERILKVKVKSLNGIPKKSDGWTPQIFKVKGKIRSLTDSFYKERWLDDGEYLESNCGYIIDYNNFILCFCLGRYSEKEIIRVSLCHSKYIEVSRSTCKEPGVFYVSNPLCSFISSFFLDLKPGCLDKYFSFGSRVFLCEHKK
jgi:hypothetical protein